MSHKSGRPKGFHVPEETRKKISESMRGTQNTKGKHWKWKKKETVGEVVLNSIGGSNE